MSPNTAWGVNATIADILRERFAAEDPGSPLPQKRACARSSPSSATPSAAPWPPSNTKD